MSHSDDRSADLLEAAATLLSEHGFSVESSLLSQAKVPWLIAEDGLFVVGVVAGQNLDEAKVLESEAAAAMFGLIDRVEVGQKRWDAYLVLLVSADAESSADARQLVALTYDTRGVRRLVAMNARPTVEAVGTVLRPFVPLPPSRWKSTGDAYLELTDQLKVNGIVETEADSLVKTFQMTGELTDV